MYILGINAYHADASACLLSEGRLIAAAEEERFRRVKHWTGFPSEAISWCLHEAGIKLRDVVHAAVNRNPRANFGRKILFSAINRPSLSLVLNRLRNARDWVRTEDDLATLRPHDPFRGEFHFIEHHLAHLASAFLVSPFEEALAISVDGLGDFASAAWGLGRGNTVSVDDRVYFPHSLGIFYQALTQYLGFPHYGDEYKVMGLAPYGNPKFVPELRQVVLLESGGKFRLDTSFFRHGKEKVAYEWQSGGPSIGTLFSPKLEAMLGPARRQDEPLSQRHHDIAKSIQTMYEEAFFHLLNALHAKYQLPALALAGGCAMNSVANGKITLSTPFRDVYVQSAAGDAGGALGAAFSVWHEATATAPRFHMDHGYWGPSFDNQAIESAIASKSEDLKANRCSASRLGNDLYARTAQAIASGKVVGWFQGAMEWGPRALGNRSIVCDPRRADMKSILNAKIKRRESFRPFAPSILREAVSDWFEIDGDVPFMTSVFQIKDTKRTAIPAVTHVDGSGRLQTVRREQNVRYYDLISAFRDLTGIPMILNTSFNENEPVVCRPEEALDCFLRTQMDVLVLGDQFIERTLSGA